MPDFNDANKLGTGKELVDRLTHLIGIFENRALDFSRNRADGDDILGDAYEYTFFHLIRSCLRLTLMDGRRFADGTVMNGIQLEGVLNLIDSNIHSNMDLVRAEVVQFLQDHADQLAEQISKQGYGTITTQIGQLRVTKEDLEAVYA
jgi:type I restriction-modification system DNA methylase subunit